MVPDDDEAIDVDESIDQLTELIVIPAWSPARKVRPAIILQRQSQALARSSLIVLPDEAKVLRAPRALPHQRSRPKRPGARAMELSAFALRAANR